MERIEITNKGKQKAIRR